MARSTLDIILPCFNPPAGWAATLPQTIAELEADLGPEVEIRMVLVNDGSKRGVGSQDLEFLQQHLPRFAYLAYETNRGKGHALRTGVAASNSDYQIYTDIDFPYTKTSFMTIFERLRSGKADIAAGIRNAEYYTHVPPARRFISKVLRWMLKTFLRTKIQDTQCGLKGFNDKGKAVFLQTRIERFLFDLEFIFLASSTQNVQIEGVEVQLKPGVTFSKARIGILMRESLNFVSIFWRGILLRLKSAA